MLGEEHAHGIELKNPGFRLAVKVEDPILDVSQMHRVFQVVIPIQSFRRKSLPFGNLENVI
jgi:hypothetical protein